jgi:CBS domain-containing protein
MRCSDIMKTNVQTVSPEDTIRLAAEKMAYANVGFLPVRDASGKVLGTVTDRDIAIRAVAKGRAPGDCRVREVMTADVVACRPDDDLKMAERVMAQAQKSRLLVTDVTGQLVGVLSLSDIAENDSGRRAAKTLREVAAREAPRH